MKSPIDLKTVLRRQWEIGARREARLLGAETAWPWLLSIGRPRPQVLRDDLDHVKRHVAAWRQVQIGEVVWEAIKYRATATAIEVPVAWKLNRPSEWVQACNDSGIRQEFEALAMLVEQTPTLFHAIWVRRRSLWVDKPLDEIVRAARLAEQLEPGCANGRPLRALDQYTIDTKFFERHARLLTTLLDVRFDGEVGRLGLECFLNALPTGEHWVLMVDLDGGLLPFRRMRASSVDLERTATPGESLIVIENETCEHSLPPLPGTIAILGSGFDLNWMKANWLRNKRVAYWGDLDTWGLQFLAKARGHVPELSALIMNVDIWEAYQAHAVREPIPAGRISPPNLNPSETFLYTQMLEKENGRLEQERIPTAVVQNVLLAWANVQDSAEPASAPRF